MPSYSAPFPPKSSLAKIIAFPSDSAVTRPPLKPTPLPLATEMPAFSASVRSIAPPLPVIPIKRR
jgi:hypothetical protein